MTLQEKFNNMIGSVVNRFTSLSQDENGSVKVEKTVTHGMPELARQAAAEGAVLIENNGVLPLKEGTVVSLFGRTYSDYFYVGYGSGGDVKAPYKVSLMQGLRNCGKIEINELLART